MIDKPLGVAATISTVLITLSGATIAMLTALQIVSWDSAGQVAVNRSAQACANIDAFCVALINAGAIIVPYLWARRLTTPLVAPKAEDGTPLVKAGSGQPTDAQARAVKREMRQPL